MVEIPKLNPSGRGREYKKYGGDDSEQISQIVYTWLFTKKTKFSHKTMDRDILGLDPLSSRGWQSMNVLHYLGLDESFKGTFLDSSLSQAISQLKLNEQNFDLVIKHLENYDKNLIESLYETGKSQDRNFVKHYKNQLAEMKYTDGRGNQNQVRKEQAILRAILFKGTSEAKCAICHRTFPTNLVIAAHIKPRSKCSTSERKNPDVVMPVCKVGCDDFFEKGYIIVDEKGVVQINEKVDCSPELKAILGALAGKHCSHFNEKTADFFAYKRESFESE